MNDPHDFPTLDSIIDDIVRGRRVVLFPPGTSIFVACNLTFLVGGALLCASILPAALQRWAVPAGAIQLTGVALLVPQVVAPAVLIVRGWRRGRTILSGLQLGWLGLSVISIGAVSAGLIGGKPQLVSSVLAAGLIGSSRLLMSTTSYRMFAAFQERLNARLAATKQQR